jgi:hypothetical protein
MRFGLWVVRVPVPVPVHDPLLRPSVAARKNESSRTGTGTRTTRKRRSLARPLQRAWYRDSNPTYRKPTMNKTRNGMLVHAPV